MRIVLWLIPAAVLGQSVLNPPSLGFFLDRAGGLRGVSGAAGSFVVERTAADGVLSFACSAGACVAKTQETVVANGLALPAPRGPALISPDSSGATIYFQQTGRFARLEDGSLKALDVSVEGEVLAIGARGRIALRRDTGVWIVGEDGGILDSLPADVQTVVLGPDSVVYATAGELVLRRADRSESHFPAPAIRELFAMSDEWVQARARTKTFALRIAPGREALYQLPEPPRSRKR